MLQSYWRRLLFLVWFQARPTLLTQSSERDFQSLFTLYTEGSSCTLVQARRQDAQSLSCVHSLGIKLVTQWTLASRQSCSSVTQLRLGLFSLLHVQWSFSLPQYHTAFHLSYLELCQHVQRIEEKISSSCTRTLTWVPRHHLGRTPQSHSSLCFCRTFLSSLLAAWRHVPLFLVDRESELPCCL